MHVTAACFYLLALLFFTFTALLIGASHKTSIFISCYFLYLSKEKCKIILVSPKGFFFCMYTGQKLILGDTICTL
jgi:hypothetical protein